jgi:hypothetical protein
MQVIHTVGAPSHTGPVLQAVEAGGWIYVSALFGADALHHAIPRTRARRLNRSSPTSRRSWPPLARR